MVPYSHRANLQPLSPCPLQSYSGGSKEWCAARREARVVFTPRPAPGARYALDFVEEVSPCSFLLHVSGPTLAAAQR